MDTANWLVGGGAAGLFLGIGTGVAVVIMRAGPSLVKFLEARAESIRRDIAAYERQRTGFESGLQATIDALRERLDVAEKDIRDCLEDRARLRQELEDMRKARG